MRYLTCDPNAETLAVNILACIDKLRGLPAGPILERHGLTNLQPTDWVPTHRFLDALNEMGQQADFMSALIAIGMSVGEVIPVPCETLGLAGVLNLWNDLYQGAHRSGDVGRIVCEEEHRTHFKLTFSDLYPDDFSYGIMYGFAKRFLPPGTQFSIYYDPRVTPRDRGGQEGYTVIHAKWQ